MDEQGIASGVNRDASSCEYETVMGTIEEEEMQQYASSSSAGSLDEEDTGGVEQQRQQQQATLEATGPAIAGSSTDLPVNEQGMVRQACQECRRRVCIDWVFFSYLLTRARK